MNHWIGIGRLTTDPIVTETHGETPTKVARYNLAVDRNKTDADFIQCTAFGRTAEFAEQHLHKGVKIAVDGRIQTGSYKDKNGDTKYTWTVVVNQTEFCEPKKTIETEAPSQDDWTPPWE